jgi:phospholipid/cholesterol/gamma-HCH transport system substrate-binding protein
MKKDSGNKIKLGLFVTIGTAIFIAGIFFIGQRQRMFVPTIQVTFICADVNGLQAGNKVRFSGIDIGTVENVELINDTSVKVDMQLEKSIKKFIKKNAKASVGSEGLMGDKVVNVIAGTSDQPEIEEGDKIECIEGRNIEQIMAHMGVVVGNTEMITGDLAAIMNNIRQGKGSIGKLFMDTVFAENLDKTMVNIKEGAGGFKQNMDAAKNSFLLKGYFKKKEREKEKAIEEKQEQKEELEKKKQKEKQ